MCAATFENVKRWLRDLRENASGPMPVVLVGNKTDLVTQRAVPKEEAQVSHDTCAVKYTVMAQTLPARFS